MGYQWVATEALTGNLICDLNFLQCQQVRQTICQYETVTAQLPIPTAPPGWERAVIEGASAFWLLEDTVTGTTPIWGGLVTAATRDQTDLVQLTLATFEWYLDQRYTGTRTYTAEDQNLIIQDLVLNVAGQGPQGGVPFQMNVIGTGQSQTIAYQDQSQQTVYSALRALTALRNGPEWYVSGVWAHNPERILPVFNVGTRVGRAQTPGLGAAVTFDMPGNLVGFQLNRQFSQGYGANSVVAYSSGTGTATPQSPVQNQPDPLRPTYELRWQPTGSNLSIPQLTSWAQQALANLSVGSPTLTLTAKADQAGTPQYGVDWNLGDDVAYQIGGPGRPVVAPDGEPAVAPNIRSSVETRVLKSANVAGGHVVYAAPTSPDSQTVLIQPSGAEVWQGNGTHDAATSSAVVNGQTITNLFSNPSFESASGTVEVRRNLCTNPNFEAGVAGWPPESGAALTQDTTSPISGVGSALLTCGTAGGGDAYFAMTVALGDTITASLDYQTVGTVSGTPKLLLQQLPATASTRTATLPLTQAVPGRFSVTLTADAAGTLIFAIFGGSAVGDKVRFDNVLIEKSSVAGPYFDGSTSPDSDLTPSWTGAAEASASILTGSIPASTLVSNPSCVLVRSGLWMVEGAHSLRVVPRAYATDPMNSFAFVGSSNAMTTLGLVAGKTYTVVGTLHLEAPQQGSLSPNARRILITGSATGGSTPSPNAAGEYEHRVTFTLPTDATGVTIRLYNGASDGNGDVWWDDVLVVEGAYTGPYFDGSFPGAWWGTGLWHPVTADVSALYPTHPLVPSLPDGAAGVAQAVSMTLSLGMTREVGVVLAGGSVGGPYLLATNAGNATPQLGV